MASHEGDIAQQAVYKITKLAYVYALPLVIMKSTLQIQTNVPKVINDKGRAPINQLANAQAFPDASFTDVVSPNADTLYSNAWLSGMLLAHRLEITPCRSLF